ncbi:MAG: recombinase family protein, partial [Nitrosopumilus sp.]
MDTIRPTVKEKVRVAGICRKSPGKKINQSIKIQKDHILQWCDGKFGKWGYDIDWFVDKSVSRDDPNRPDLNKFFEDIDEYNYAVSLVVDRFGSGFLPVKWFHEHFITNDGREPHEGCRLSFVHEVPNLYRKD